MKGGVLMLIYKVFVVKKIVIDADKASLYSAEGARIRSALENSDCMAVMVLNSEFDLTIQKVKRLERLLGSVFNEKVSVIY
jgi:hypothetical protein